MTGALPLCLGLALVASAPSTDDLATEAERLLGSRFDRVGRRRPALDPVLNHAAINLALVALRDWELSVRTASLQRALAEAGAPDPYPRAIVLRATKADLALARLAQRSELTTQPASHFGIGIAHARGHVVLAVLLADRAVALSAFPRRLPKAGGRERLCGELRAPLAKAEIDVAGPDGRVTHWTSSSTGRSFCAWIELGSEGRHQIEVLGNGPSGPEVCASLAVDVGEGVDAASPQAAPEPASPTQAREVIARRIEALRGSFGLSPLQQDAALEAIAQAYGDRLAREQRLVHIASDGEDVGRRLSEQGYRYRRAAENLASAQGPFAAQEAIEGSPGHLRNLIDPSYRRIGIGISRASEDGPVVITEVLADPEIGPSASDDVYRTWIGRRRAHRLAPLARSQRLEALARTWAERALALGEPPDLSFGTRLEEKALSVLPEAKRVSVDFFVLDSLQAVPETRGQVDPDNRELGVGWARGASQRFGRDKFWVVAIYAAP